MPIESSRTGNVCPKDSRDPRSQLANECYYTSRPEPLETWLWEAKVPAAAERVFWLHWREGMRSGDWCSQIPISVVAAHCRVDQSTVTRAYQLLGTLGILRRADPGRDPRNPFCQATAVTEVLLPRGLLARLHTLPKRQRARAAERPATPPSPAAVPVQAPSPAPQVPNATGTPPLRMKDRLRQLGALTSKLSAAESERWRAASFQHSGVMTFDDDTKLSPEQQAELLRFMPSPTRPSPETVSRVSPTNLTAPSNPRHLSVFDLARISRAVQKLIGSSDVEALTRQIIWAVEEGALKKHQPALAINIALKKVRDQAWTRPNRMPPNWVRRISHPAGLETCSGA